jgi:MFS family permease
MALTRADPRAGEPRPEAVIRRLVLVVGAVVFLDTLFYAVIVPLLPQLTHELRLSKLSAGLMTAAYPTGMLVASVPAGLLAARVGPRLTVLLGLSLLACSTVAFGFVDSAAALDLARILEGVGGACSWAGGIAWIVAEAPSARRGEVIGRAVGAAIFGALFGPAIGALASAIGRSALFCALAVLALALIALIRTLPDHGEASNQGVRAMVTAVGRRPMPQALWLMLLPAIGSGILAVLGPLQMHRFGAGAAAIGATWLVAAALEAAVAPVIGRVSDRRGRLVPLRAGLGAGAVTLACFTLPSGAAALAVVIICTALAFGLFWAPAMALLTDTAEAAGLDYALGAALMNLAWSGGQIVGSAGAGALAKAGGDLLPTAGAAAVCAVTAVALLRRRPEVRDPAVSSPSSAA